MSTILLPFVFSTSGYNSPAIDYSVPTDPPIAAAICRASIGTAEWMGGTRVATDQSFPHYWPQWDLLHLPRGAYHFLKNKAGGADQARWFVARVNAAGGFHPCDRIVLDAEESANLSISEMIDFLWNTTLLVPEVPIKNYLIYSGKYLLNALSLTKLNEEQKEFLRSIRQWPAGYPDDISGWDFTKLAHNYQADLTKFGPAVLVQYAASATVPGLSLPGFESVECNAIDPNYLAEWQADVAAFYGSNPSPLPPPIPPPTTPPGGGTMARYKLTVIWPAGATIRPEASTSNNGIAIYPQGAVIYASELTVDGDNPTDPSKQWAKIESDPINNLTYAGRFVAVKYPGSSGALDRCTVQEITPTPPPTTSAIDHIEVVYKDGTEQTFVPQ